MTTTSDGLRHFADRLEWVYPAEHDSDLFDMIGPLFRETVDGDDGEASSRS